MPKDAATRKDMERMRNRMLDFNPEIQLYEDVLDVTDTDIKGMDNAHMLLSAGFINLVVRVDGVPFKVAMTSAF